MKRILFVSFLVLTVVVNARAQYKIGLNALPFMSINRVTNEIDSISLSNNGAGYSVGLGLMFDLEMKENYYFSTGIYWFPKTIRLSTYLPDGSPKDQTFNVQYVQLPLTLKLTTDEFSIDKRFFFQLGPTFDIKVSESPKSGKNNFYIDKFNFMDINLNFGAGIEIKLGYNTAFFGGLSYYRGLINAFKPAGIEKGYIRIKNDMVSLNLGLKF